MKKVKISELPESESMQGLYTIGTNSENESVKVSLEFVETKVKSAVEACETATVSAESATTKATSAANSATTAANEATSATNSANEATTKATSATSAATTATANANSATEAANNATSAAISATTSATEAAEAATEGLAEVLAALNPYYGIEFDTAVSSPTCTRIGVADLHRRLPIQNRMKGCILDDNGNVVEYLDPNDWTTAIRDGSRGQVMVEIPKHWRKCETDGTVRRVLLSEVELPGYHVVPLMYVSAYEATVQRSTKMLASVVNADADYRGGNDQSEYDDDEGLSLLGRPASNLSRLLFRTYARNRNEAATNEWNCYTYDAHKAIYWLFVVEYATLNSQLAFNAEKTDEGYRQGGLGAGVTTLNQTLQNTWNGLRPFVPCGYTDALGNNTGVVDFEMPESYGATLTVEVPRYRGIEHPFGHIYKHTDGCLIIVNPDEEDGGDGYTRAYVTSDPSLFGDSDYSQYSMVGTMMRVSAYFKEVVFGEFGDIFSSERGGSSSTYFCDYLYNTTIGTSTLTRGLLVGGRAFNGANAGFACANAYFAPSASAASVGSRLCFIPQSE